MPITESAKKAMRQSRRRNIRNDARRSAYRGAVKVYRKLIAGNKIDEAVKELPKVFKLLDKAAKSGVITKNKANRLKSRLARRGKTKASR